jgi:hypothetical protein
MIGEWALHIQCPWRIERGDAIYTGRSDLFNPENGRYDDAYRAALDGDGCFDYESGNLRDRKIFALFDGVAETSAGQALPDGRRITVEAVDADRFGGASIVLSDGLRLVIFPDASMGEAWRFFSLADAGEHFVIEDGGMQN